MPCGLENSNFKANELEPNVLECLCAQQWDNLKYQKLDVNELIK